MQDRQPTKPNRVKLTLEDGTVLVGVLVRNDEPTVPGTPINKNTLFSNENSEKYACELPSEAFDLISRDIDVTVPVSGWSAAVGGDGYFYNIVDANGVKESHSPMFGMAPVAVANLDEARNAFALIDRMVTHDNSVTFKAAEKPEVDVIVRIKGV